MKQQKRLFYNVGERNVLTQIKTENFEFLHNGKK